MPLIILRDFYCGEPSGRHVSATSLALSGCRISFSSTNTCYRQVGRRTQEVDSNPLFHGKVLCQWLVVVPESALVVKSTPIRWYSFHGNVLCQWLEVVPGSALVVKLTPIRWYSFHGNVLCQWLEVVPESALVVRGWTVVSKLWTERPSHPEYGNLLVY